MGDLKSKQVIVLKGWLFLVLACISAGLLLFEHPSLRTGLLLAITIWSACRFYYFAFYVIQHYVDVEFRFAGLFAFVMWSIRHRHTKTKNEPERGPLPGTDSDSL